jgi:hypothetical protein
MRPVKRTVINIFLFPLHMLSVDDAYEGMHGCQIPCTQFSTGRFVRAANLWALAARDDRLSNKAMQRTLMAYLLPPT